MMNPKSPPYFKALILKIIYVNMSLKIRLNVNGNSTCAFLFMAGIIFSVFFAPNSGYCKYNDEKVISEAAEFLNLGKYLEAIGLYKEITTVSKNLNSQARALFFIGRTYSLYLDQYDTALQQFQKILKEYPDSLAAPDALFNMGMVTFELGQYPEAYKYFTQYIKKYPSGWNVQSAIVWADSAKSLIQKTGPATPTPKQPLITDDSIRVLLLENTKAVHFEANTPLSVLNPFTQKAIHKGSKAIRLTHNGGHLRIDGRSTGSQKLIVASASTAITLNGTPYRGRFTVWVEPKGILVVNTIQVEDYLYGVVPKEMPATWEKEALMAQSVAARTYALYVKEKSIDKPYDVVATTLSQVYGGYAAEEPTTNEATDATRGQVMTYDGKLIVAYFHSNSGGYTEDPQYVWGAALPYLQAVPDMYSKNAPNSAWDYYLTYKEARKRLSEHGFSANHLNRLDVTGKSKSGRILQIVIPSNNGLSRISCNNFRLKIGGMKIKSTLFDLKHTSKGIQFKGKGFGHGVGMSQWGAKRMAQAGASYDVILKHYYRNVKIAQLGND